MESRISSQSCKVSMNPFANGARQRRAHRKSRLGCRNCKLLSVKCDEGKPNCDRCIKSGLTCTYTQTTEALQFSHTQSFKLDLNPSSPTRHPPYRIPAASPADGLLDHYQLRSRDVAALSRFHQRTIWTVGDGRIRHIYAEKASSLARSNPFLLHMFIAVALMHDVFFDPQKLNTPANRATVALHMYHATSLFKLKVLKSSTEQQSEADPIWLGCSLLSVTSFGNMNIVNPSEAWPLKDSDDGSDLEWLGMSDGKVALANMALMSDEGTLCKDILNVLDYSSMHNYSAVEQGILPSDFYSLFDLSPNSSPEFNPYHTAASILSQLFHRQINDCNLGDFMAFAFYAHRSYRSLLQIKDHLALLLLVYWYSKIAVHSAPWWMQRRAFIEGAAICIYLERECTDRRILNLLHYSRAVLLANPGSAGI